MARLSFEDSMAKVCQLIGYLDEATNILINGQVVDAGICGDWNAEPESAYEEDEEWESITVWYARAMNSNDDWAFSMSDIAEMKITEDAIYIDNQKITLLSKSNMAFSHIGHWFNSGMPEVESVKGRSLADLIDAPNENLVNMPESHFVELFEKRLSELEETDIVLNEQLVIDSGIDMDYMEPNAKRDYLVESFGNFVEQTL